MKIQESGENYLETILLLEKKLGFVRSIDIAHELDYTKASISRAVAILKKGGFIKVDEIGHITLTEIGKQTADNIYERHNMITKYLVMTLGVSIETAEKDACRIEHVISSEVFNKIRDFVISNIL